MGSYASHYPQLRQALTEKLSQIGHWLLPQSCFLCGELSRRPLCEGCLNDLPSLTMTCHYCGCALERAGVCADCQQQRPLYAKAQAVFSYTYPLDLLIHAAKFNHNLAVLTLLGELMAHRLINTHPEVLIPIPLHPRRFRHRGYNQALELAKIIAKQTHIPLADKVCIRCRDTPPQYMLTAEQRKTNLIGAFKVRTATIPWRSVAVVDDVLTTGSTAWEMTGVLLNAGVQHVEIWCCAKA